MRQILPGAGPEGVRAGAGSSEMREGREGGRHFWDASHLPCPLGFCGVGSKELAYVESLDSALKDAAELRLKVSDAMLRNPTTIKCIS